MKTCTYVADGRVLSNSADLRAALQRALPLLSFAAGREAATAPDQSGILTADDDITDLLVRTAL